MNKPMGLRAEILVQTAFLVGAALLLVSFLLLKITERELLEERVVHARGLMQILAHVVSSMPPGNISDSDLRKIAAELPAGTQLTFFVGVHQDSRPIRLAGPERTADPFEESALRQARLTRETLERVVFPAIFLPFGPPEESFLLHTVPVFPHRQELGGVLQARFPLADIRERLMTARRFVFFYVVAYGAILLVTGAYLLGRTVIGPVRRLMTATGRVAAGDLEQPVNPSGPREINELALSFNAMVAALKESRRQTEDHIRSLEQVNEDLHRTQQELVRSERLASVGHLAAGMAHEIGNPLGAVMGYLEILKGGVSSAQEKDLIERAIAEAGRIDRLVRDLLDYAGPGDGHPETLDPAGVLAEAQGILSHQGLFAGLRIDDENLRPLAPVFISRHKLLQVFVNLLVNARDAMAEGGKIVLAGGEEGKNVWVAVADDGCGIAAEKADHVYDPFFTTKEPGKGRGLGLTVSHRIIAEAGGRIDLRSVPGKGSRFTVWLKKVEEHGRKA
jgi:two-component system, NtrC family, sensor kinase